MKTMNCKQLGGACDKTFTADTFDHMVEIIKQHSMSMFRDGDEAHLKATGEMQKLMQNPEAIKVWFENKRREFDQLPEDVITTTGNIDHARIDDSIKSLKLYVKEVNIDPILSILESLKQQANGSLIQQLKDRLNDLGPTQGAVLTYAPYITFLLSNNPFRDE